MLHEKSSTYGGPVVSSASRSADQGKPQKIMISRHQLLVRPKEEHHRRAGQKDGRKSEKILVSRHQLRRPNNEVKRTNSSSESILVRKIQNKSMRSSYGSTGQSLKNLRNSTRSITSASSSMNSNNEVKMSKSSSESSILVRKTQNKSMRSAYGSTGQSLKNLRNSSRSFTSASSSMNSINEVKRTESSSRSILVRKTQNESMRSSYGSAGQILKRSFTSASSSMKRNVSFDKVSIREYPRCVGDNPSVTTGPPIS